MADFPGLTLGGPAVDEATMAWAEAQVGALPPSYTWWLRAGGHGTILGEEIAGIAPAEHAASAVGVITEQWRGGGGLLCFHTGPDGEAYCFERAPGHQVGDEQVVVRVDEAGEREQFATSFAGFLTRHDALRRGMGDGPVPALVRVWGHTPGLLRDDGVHIYGPHEIAERNETYEIAEYAPDWVMVGDDSGGSGLFIRRHGKDRSTVLLVGMGAVDAQMAEFGKEVTTDLVGWLESGAELPE